MMDTTPQEEAKRASAWSERRWLKMFLITVMVILSSGVALYTAASRLQPSLARAQAGTASEVRLPDLPSQNDSEVAAESPPAFPLSTALGQNSSASSKNDECLACHRSKTLTLVLGDGENLSLYVDGDTLGKSVHANLDCVSCHADYSGYPHETDNFASKRSFELGTYGLCEKCHSDVAKKNADGVHATALANVTQNAPVCTDCHGAHDVQKPSSPRTAISQTCAKCHQPVYDKYVGSVHGAALVQEGNTDVPVCTDCHGVHNIANPETATFRTNTPELCARCHNDRQLMSKYGVSSAVYKTYSDDFHGVTNKLYEVKLPTVWPAKAVCTDCHGVHDIQKVDAEDSRVSAKNLLGTCQQCHPTAGAKFVAAWTEHQVPTAQNSSATYYVNLFYKLVIPTTLVGLVAFMSLDFVRARSHRSRKEGQR